mmetsp:Transcript_1902/g.4281  ORF Transcript_1902/g.4281 Transcript_1902/m.4281 type:complete len:392 (-) Transcript_1902:653-1828(-)
MLPKQSSHSSQPSRDEKRELRTLSLQLSTHQNQSHSSDPAITFAPISQILSHPNHRSCRLIARNTAPQPLLTPPWRETRALICEARRSLQIFCGVLPSEAPRRLEGVVAEDVVLVGRSSGDGEDFEHLALDLRVVVLEGHVHQRLAFVGHRRRDSVGVSGDVDEARQLGHLASLHGIDEGLAKSAVRHHPPGMDEDGSDAALFVVDAVVQGVAVVDVSFVQQRRRLSQQVLRDLRVVVDGGDVEEVSKLVVVHTIHGHVDLLESLEVATDHGQPALAASLLEGLERRARLAPRGVAARVRPVRHRRRILLIQVDFVAVFVALDRARPEEVCVQRPVDLDARDDHVLAVVDVDCLFGRLHDLLQDALVRRVRELHQARHVSVADVRHETLLQ